MSVSRDVPIFLVLVMLCSVLGTYSQAGGKTCEREIKFNVSVWDKNHNFLTDLTEKNFKVFRGGSAQMDLCSFKRVNEPMSIGILISTTRLMRQATFWRSTGETIYSTSFLPAISRGIDSFAANQSGKIDYFVVQFGKEIATKVDATEDVGQLNGFAADLLSTEPAGNIPTLDALEFGLQKIAKAKHLRRALILVSHWFCGSSKYTNQGKIERVIRTANVPIYFVRMGSIEGLSKGPQNYDCGNELVEDSGGVFISADTVTVAKAFELIAKELNNQYEIGVIPDAKAKPNSWNKVSIRLLLPHEREQSLGKTFIKGNQGFYF